MPAEMTAAPSEGLTRVDGLEMYRIGQFDRLPPFLMSIVSDSDLWMYVSSAGGLTAGRINEDRALFPYETDDRLHRRAGTSGPITLLRVHRADGTIVLWEPFAAHCRPKGAQRNCYKAALSNQLVFEEVNPELGLSFRYRWANSDAMGFVRTAWLECHDAPVQIEVLDGLLDILPGGTSLAAQREFSCLINAYTQCEADAATRLAIYAMASRMVDRPEPAESLRANVAWSTSEGMESTRILMCDRAVTEFRNGHTSKPQERLTGRRGAYLISATASLRPAQTCRWHIVADVDRTQAQVVALRRMLRETKALGPAIENSLKEADSTLRRMVAAADGSQQSADPIAAAHHGANVLFNVMRGGIFLSNYTLPGEDVAAFIRERNHDVARIHASFLATLPCHLDHQQLLRAAAAQNDPDLLRLCMEYLPITFSRRHGDPSRPWNRFTVRLRNPDGSPLLSYQGNWRDIFQNWEALCLSYPEFIESVIAKFVNASTADGFNPYRITREGIDWEVPDPGNPWSNIGYWGDHQIIYLLKFLEASRRYHPGALERMLISPTFTYADVPYRLKSYQQILRDPGSTINYDEQLAHRITQRVRERGADGKLLTDGEGRIYRVTLLEKLLVPMLAKVSNLVVDGGIWMNTQRPEWNDANNALVGRGLSMVTHCYLRRHVAFCIELLSSLAESSAPMSGEVIEWLEGLGNVLRQNRALLDGPTIRDRDRKRILDGLAQAYDHYRQRIYARGFTSQAAVPIRKAIGFLQLLQEYLDHGIRANRREDGLYHGYNLLELSADGESLAVGRLYEMLEGQVAVLSSGLLSAEEAIALVQGLLSSRLYRADQQSFILYPDRRLAGFLEKNRIPTNQVQGNALLRELIQQGDSAVIVRDAEGDYRFNSDFANGRDVARALEQLAADPRFAPLVQTCRAATLDTFERIFNHRTFTGRSGGMYGYEGLGSIYWHMVAKLLVAVQECWQQAVRDGRPQEIRAQLAELYYRVRGGLGFCKSAESYGAFPVDPYSHTPKHAGAQQPGMTGQVKEEILTRWGELGVQVLDGHLSFAPGLLQRSEFVAEPSRWEYHDVHGEQCAIDLPPDSLAFTCCQVPIVYHLGEQPRLKIVRSNQPSLTRDELSLDAASSASIFSRAGEIERIEVEVSLRRT